MLSTQLNLNSKYAAIQRKNNLFFKFFILIFSILVSIFLKGFLCGSTDSILLESEPINSNSLDNTPGSGGNETALKKEGWTSNTKIKGDTVNTVKSQNSIEYFSDRSKNVLEKDGWTGVTQEYFNDVNSGKNIDYSVLFLGIIVLSVIGFGLWAAFNPDPRPLLTGPNDVYALEFIRMVIRDHTEIIEVLDRSSYSSGQIIAHSLITYRDARVLAYKNGLVEGTDDWKVFILDYVNEYFFTVVLCNGPIKINDVFVNRSFV